MTLLRGITVCLFIAIGLLLFTSRGFSTELTLPEEALYEKALAGNINEAREGFKKLFEERIALLDQAGSSADESVRSQNRKAMLLDKAVRVIEFMELTEAHSVIEGALPSDEALQTIVNSVNAVKGHAAQIQALRNKSKGKVKAGPEAHEWKDVDSSLERTGKIYLNTSALLRNTKLQHHRGRLLSEARKYINAPANLGELDSQYGDIEKVFHIKSQKKAALNGGGAAAQQTVRRLEKDDGSYQALESFLGLYFDKLLAGDILKLKELFSNGYWPEQDLKSEIRELQGWTRKDLGDIYLRDISPDENEVSVSDIKLINANGEVRKTGTSLILRKISPSEYRIVFLGTDEKRKR